MTTMAHVMMIQRNPSVDSMPSMGTEITTRISNTTGHSSNSQKELSEVYDSPKSPGEETRNSNTCSLLVVNSFHHEIYDEELTHIEQQQQPKAEATSELGEEFTMDLKDNETTKDASSTSSRSRRRGRSSSRSKSVVKDNSSSSSRSKSRSSSKGRYNGQVSVSSRSQDPDRKKDRTSRSKSRLSKTASSSTSTSSKSTTQDAAKESSSRSKSKDAKSSSSSTRSKSKDSKYNTSTRSKSKDHKKERIRREGSKKSIISSGSSDASSLAHMQSAPKASSSATTTVEERLVLEQKQHQTLNDILGLLSSHQRPTGQQQQDPIRAKSLHQGPGQDSTEETLLRSPMPTKKAMRGKSDHGCVPLTLWDMKQTFQRDFPARPMPSDVALRQRYHRNHLPLFSSPAANTNIRTTRETNTFPAHQYSPPNTNRDSLNLIEKVASDRWLQDESLRSSRSSFTNTNILPATMNLPPLHHHFTESNHSDRVVVPLLAEPTTQASPSITLNSFMNTTTSSGAAAAAMSVGGDEQRKSVTIPWLFQNSNKDIDIDDDSVDESFIQCLDAFDETGDDNVSSFDIAPHRPKRCNSSDESDLSVTSSLNSTEVPTTPSKKQPIPPESPIRKSPTSLKTIVSKVKSVVLMREGDNNERPDHLNSSSKPEQEPRPETPSKQPIPESPSKSPRSLKKIASKVKSVVMGEDANNEKPSKKKGKTKANKRSSKTKNETSVTESSRSVGDPWDAVPDGLLSPRSLKKKTLFRQAKSRMSSLHNLLKADCDAAANAGWGALDDDLHSEEDEKEEEADTKTPQKEEEADTKTPKKGEAEVTKSPRKSKSNSKSSTSRSSSSRPSPSKSPSKSKRTTIRRSSKVAKEGELISNHDNDLPAEHLQLDVQSSQGTVVTLDTTKGGMKLNDDDDKKVSKRRSVAKSDKERRSRSRSKTDKSTRSRSKLPSKSPSSSSKSKNPSRRRSSMRSSQGTVTTLDTTTSGEMNLKDDDDKKARQRSASKSDKERRRSRSKVSSSEIRSPSQKSRSCSPGTLRSDKHKKRQTRSRSPGALRGDIARKRQSMNEIRAKRKSSSRDVVKEDCENSASKFSPSVSSRKRVVSPETLNIRAASPEREIADFDPCNESLEDLLKKVKQKAKDLRAEKAKLGGAQHRLSLNESSLPAAFRSEAGNSTMSNIFCSSLEW